MHHARLEPRCIAIIDRVTCWLEICRCLETSVTVYVCTGWIRAFEIIDERSLVDAFVTVRVCLVVGVGDFTFGDAVFDNFAFLPVVFAVASFCIPFVLIPLIVDFGVFNDAAGFVATIRLRPHQRFGTCGWTI